MVFIRTALPETSAGCQGFLTLAHGEKHTGEPLAIVNLAIVKTLLYCSEAIGPIVIL